MKSRRIVSLLPAATEIAAALGLMDEIVGVSHECDYPAEANKRPRVTHCLVHSAGLTSGQVDESVRRRTAQERHDLHDRRVAPARPAA